MSTNAVIYARFSSDKQREESIDGQIRECKAFAQANQLNVIAIYIDRAMSARTDHRPDFLRMIKDSRSGAFDYVLVYQLDRFSRSRYDSAIYKHELKKNGVKVLSAKENITDSPTGIMLEAMLEGYAEYYSAELSQKVRRGMTENLLEHKWNGSPVPLGYALDANHRLVIDPDMAPHVKALFEMFLAGKSYAELARYLDEKHIRTVTGRKYTGPTVHNLMSRQLYTGTYTWGGQVIENFCPAIISKSDFSRAALRMANRKRTAKDGIPMSVRRSPEYALTGIIYCGECGRTMTGYSGRGQMVIVITITAAIATTTVVVRRKKSNVRITLFAAIAWKTWYCRRRSISCPTKKLWRPLPSKYPASNWKTPMPLSCPISSHSLRI